jgi:hypothetical protein
MRILVSLILLLTLALPGCASKQSAAQSGTARAGGPALPTTVWPTNQALIVTPESGLVGRVARVNWAGRFVVLNFPLGRMAAVEQRLNLYRRGLKVGEVRVTGPQREDNIVADLVAGEAAVGDEARSQ